MIAALERDQVVPDPLDTAEEHERFLHKDLHRLDVVELNVEELRALDGLRFARDVRERQWLRERLARVRAVARRRRRWSFLGGAIARR